MPTASQELIRTRAIAEAAQRVLAGCEGLEAVEVVCQCLGEVQDIDRFLVLEADEGQLTTLYEWIRPRSADLGTAAIDRTGRELSVWLSTIVPWDGPAISRRDAPHEGLGPLAAILHHPRPALWVDDLAVMILPNRGGSLLLLVAERFTRSERAPANSWDATDLEMLAATGRLLGTVLQREEIRRQDADRLDDAHALRTIIDEQTELIVRRTDVGTISFVNEAFCRFFGRRREELIGTTWQPEIPSQDQILVDFRLANLTPESPVTAIEHRVVMRGHEVRWLSWTDRARFSSEGTILDVQSVGRDITEQRRAEEALRCSEEQFRTLIEQAPEGIFLLDLDLVFVDVNVRACTLLAVSRHQILGQHLTVVLHPDDHGGLDEELREALAGSTISGERRFVRADGQILPGEFIAKHMPDGRLLLFVRDVSERKRYEQALIEAKEQAEEASHTKGSFLANMSHELRTPLTGIIGMSELLEETNLQEDQRDFVETLRSCASNLLALINDALDYAKIEAGRMELEAIPFSPSQLVEDTLQLLSEQARAKGLELIAAASPDLPSSLVGDPQRLRQVLTNLIGNAIKFTDSGEVEVRLTPHPAEDTDLVPPMEFTVRDTGIGIEPGSQARLFQAFVQADSSMTRKYGGTGLGLAITKRLVELMGGAIHLSSAPGRGSSFSFTLRLPAGPLIEARPRALPPRRVLLLVGNDSLRGSLAGHLLSWGLAVQAAAIPEQIPMGPWDLVITDRPEGVGVAPRALALVPLGERCWDDALPVVSRPVRLLRLREAIEAGLAL